jgi:hypothetical protein
MLLRQTQRMKRKTRMMKDRPSAETVALKDVVKRIDMENGQYAVAWSSTTRLMPRFDPIYKNLHF